MDGAHKSLVLRRLHELLVYTAAGSCRSLMDNDALPSWGKFGRSSSRVRKPSVRLLEPDTGPCTDQQPPPQASVLEPWLAFAQRGLKPADWRATWTENSQAEEAPQNRATG